MSYLLIILVVGLALAPLAHFVPSKRQRRQARMREYAALHGLYVEFRTVPEGVRLGPEVPAQAVIYYGKRLPAALAARVERQAWAREADGWRALGQRRPSPAALSELPAEVLAAGIDEASCGVYWTESGDTPAVEQICRVLTEWQDALVS